MNRQLGPYQLKDRLGSGGMAEVYLAHARRRGNVVQPCVVKLLHKELARDDDFAEMLIEEARLVAHLRHNNIASLYDVERHDGELFLVMEYVDGQDLHSILARTTKLERMLPLPFAVHVARGLCAGLHFAHTRRGPEGDPLDLVHRDVSPPNVLVSTQGEVKLIDFGIAKFNSEAREKTRSGVIKGKFGYMSPEHAWGEELDQRSDLFSVGVCLYEMLTGRSLYGQSDDAMALLRRAREADIDPITNWRDVPDSLARIVHRSLEIKPDDRFPTAHHMERRLALVLRELAPDYTALDAGALVDEFFDTNDPAHGEMGPRLGSDTDGRLASTDETETAERDARDTTRPIKDLPPDLGRGGEHRRPQSVRDSGRYSRPDPADGGSSRDAGTETTEIDTGDETDDSEEPTAVLTFDDEDTELFDEQRISGPQPTISADDVAGRNDCTASSNSPRPAPPDARRPEESTRIIDNATRHDARTADGADGIDDTSTDPIHNTAPIAGERRDTPPPSSHEKSPAKSDDQLSTTKDMPQKIHAHDLDSGGAKAPPGGGSDGYDVAAEQRPRIASTGALPALSDRPASSGDGEESAPDDDDNGDGFLDRRIQIALAAGFVVIALLYVMSRLF